MYISLTKAYVCPMNSLNVVPKQSSIKKNTETTSCIRCGVCLRVCTHKLSPILIKEAFEKAKKDRLIKLKAELCEGCGNCTYVCPARIDLRSIVLRAKVSLN